MLPSLEDIRETFSLLDSWEDRYRYVIDLGKELDPLPDAARTEENKVRGCASQVWVETVRRESPEGVVLDFRGDSDAHIVKGLVALILALYSGKTPQAILNVDALGVFRELGLADHLTPQRSNGVRSMVDRIRRDADAARG
jgi:cysteine desulfuration protein SufE